MATAGLSSDEPDDTVTGTVHVFVAGKVVESGGPELADELEENGYEKFSAAPAGA